MNDMHHLCVGCLKFLFSPYTPRSYDHIRVHAEAEHTLLHVEKASKNKYEHVRDQIALCPTIGSHEFRTTSTRTNFSEKQRQALQKTHAIKTRTHACTTMVANR